MVKSFKKYNTCCKSENLKIFQYEEPPTNDIFQWMKLKVIEMLNTMVILFALSCQNYPTPFST